MKIKNWKGLLVFAMLGALLLGCALQGGGETIRRLSYPEFWQLAQQGEIASVTLSDSADWQVILRSGKAASTPNPRSQRLPEIY